MEKLFKAGNHAELLDFDQSKIKEIIQVGLDAIMGTETALLRVEYKEFMLCFNSYSYKGGQLCSELQGAIEQVLTATDGIVAQQAELAAKSANEDGSRLESEDELETQRVELLVEAEHLRHDETLIKSNAAVDERCAVTIKAWDHYTAFANCIFSGDPEVQLSGGEHSRRYATFDAYMKANFKDFDGKLYFYITEHLAPQWLDELAAGGGGRTLASFTSQGSEHQGKTIKERIRDLFGIMKAKGINPHDLMIKERMQRLLHFAETIPKHGIQKCSVCECIGHNKNNHTCKGAK